MLSPSKAPALPADPIISKQTTTVDPVQARKDQIWIFMETNKIFNIIMLLFILVSTVAFCLETMREMEKYDGFFMAIEIFFVFVFTVEYVARFYSTPQEKMAFVTEFLNIIDFIAIAPFYLEIVYHIYIKSQSIDLDSDSNTTVLRSLRLARLFKFGRYSPELSLVTGAFMRSAASFLMLGFMLTIALVTCSTLMFLAEQGTYNEEKNCYMRTSYDAIPGGWEEESCSPFQSIPQTFWWAITTMTTVGYGDTYPITTTGKVISGFAMLVGILSVALPTTVLGVQFGDSYNAIEEERKRLDIQRNIKGEMKKVELIRYADDFVATKKQIFELREKLDSVALKLCIGPGQESFQRQLKIFGDNVEASAQSITELLDEATN